MNVAIFTDNDFNKVNGVTTVLKAVLEHLPADIKARVYTCESRRRDDPDYLAQRAFGVGVPFYSEMKMYLPRFGAFLKQARADRVDLVHFTTPGPVGLAAMWVAARLERPMIGSFHTDLAEYARLLSGSDRLGRLMQEYMRWPYGRCQQILAPSAATRETLINSKIDPAKIRIWSRGVSVTRFTPEKRSAALRRRWGVSEARPALIYVGRVSREKGLQALPRLQWSLRRAALDHRLIIVGEGPMREELERSCPDAVFTGSQSHDRVAEAMASADLFVFPSRTDTAGNVVLEAQASGLPVLVTNEGGPKEHMRAGETGEVCVNDADLASHTIGLMLDRTRRAQMSRAARDYAMTRSWDAALAPLFASYREVMLSSRAPQNARGPLESSPQVRASGL